MSPAFKNILGLPLRLDALHYATDVPLPPAYGPEEIHIKLHLLLRQHGHPVEIIDTTPRTLAQTANSQIAMLSDDMLCSPDPLVAAVLNAERTRTCFQCGAADHRLFECPRFKLVMSDEFVRKTLLRALGKSGEPQAPRLIRQIECSIQEITTGPDAAPDTVHVRQITNESAATASTSIPDLNNDPSASSEQIFR